MHVTWLAVVSHALPAYPAQINHTIRHSPTLSPALLVLTFTTGLLSSLQSSSEKYARSSAAHMNRPLVCYCFCFVLHI